MSGFDYFRSRLEEKSGNVKARPAIYVAFGDSVTQGCMEYGVIEHKEVFHHLFKRQVERRYPRTVLSVVNSGVSGDTADRSRIRWERDLWMYRPDFVTLSFGVNDAHGGMDQLARYIQAMRELIRGTKERTPADMVLLTPNRMMNADNPRIHESDRKAVPRFLQTAQDDSLFRYVEELRNLADEEGVPLVDVYGMFEELEQEGQDIHLRLANGINHPDREMHRLIANRIEEAVFEVKG